MSSRSPGSRRGLAARAAIEQRAVELGVRLSTKEITHLEAAVDEELEAVRALGMRLTDDDPPYFASLRRSVT